MARFVLLPQDDLNLACLLKSPLVGLDEDKLFTWPGTRRGHLWRALRERGRAEPHFAAAHERLAALAAARRLHHAVRFLRPGARPRRRPRAPARAAGPRGGRSDRRAAGAGAAVPAGRGAARCKASCAGSSGRRRDQARPRPEPPPRGAHPDGARVQGPAGADRLPARHHARARDASGCWPAATARPGCGCRAPTTPTRPRAAGAPTPASARCRNRTVCSMSR